MEIKLSEVVKSHAHFCADCGNDVFCERAWCFGIMPGEQSVECLNCYQKRCEAGFSDDQIGG